MPLQPPCRLCADVADRLVGSLTLESAYESIRAAFLETMFSDTLIFAQRDGGWQRVAGRSTTARETAWKTLLGQIGEAPACVTRLGDPAVATAVRVVVDDDQVAIVIEHDWLDDADTLETCAKIIQLAMRRIRAEQRERQLHKMVAPALRLRTGKAAARSQRVLAQDIVERIAAMFNAERVSLALFSRDEQALQIVAARGLADEILPGVRIKPGDWPLGHVYARSRVLAVADVRRLPRHRPNPVRYKTDSFAAIPLTYLNQTLGVIAITDRRDGCAFGMRDRAALRVIGIAAGAALAAAGAHERIEKLEHKASIDSVTGLFNRGYFDTRLLEEIQRSQREGTQLAVLIADIDNFKAINDTFGHQVGDAVLKQVGEIIRSTLRIFDVCARFGGDEFSVVMPNSDASSAFTCAERIRKMAAQYNLPELPSFPQLTVSVGVAVAEGKEGAAAVVARADRAMYRAKAAGKNAVRGAEHDDLRVPEAGRSGAADSGTAADAHRTHAEDVTAQARQLSGTAGSATYWMDPIVGKMRAVVRWTAESPMSGCQHFLPRAVEQVFTRGEARTFGDVAPSSRDADTPGPRISGAHALVAPARNDHGTVAAIAVFDDVAVQVTEEFRRALEEVAASAADRLARDLIESPNRRQRRTDQVGREQSRDRRTMSIASLGQASDKPPTLLERQRGEFEVARELARSRREQRQMSVILFDISQQLRQQQREPIAEFARDAALRDVVDTFVRAVRQSDLPIRWSGNELLLVLPGVAGVDARAVAERVRAAMEAGGRRQLSVSGGVAELERDEQFGTIVERARAKVAAAQDSGDNRVS